MSDAMVPLVKAPPRDRQNVNTARKTSWKDTVIQSYIEEGLDDTHGR